MRSAYHRRSASSINRARDILNLATITKRLGKNLSQHTHYGGFSEVFVTWFDYCDCGACSIVVDVTRTTAHPLASNHYVFECKSMYESPPKPSLLAK